MMYCFSRLRKCEAFRAPIAPVKGYGEADASDTLAFCQHSNTR